MTNFNHPKLGTLTGKIYKTMTKQFGGRMRGKLYRAVNNVFFETSPTFCKVGDLGLLVEEHMYSKEFYKNGTDVVSFTIKEDA